MFVREKINPPNYLIPGKINRTKKEWMGSQRDGMTKLRGKVRYAAAPQLNAIRQLPKSETKSLEFVWIRILKIQRTKNGCPGGTWPRMRVLFALKNAGTAGRLNRALIARELSALNDCWASLFIIYPTPHFSLTLMFFSANWFRMSRGNRLITTEFVAQLTVRRCDFPYLKTANSTYSMNSFEFYSIKKNYYHFMYIYYQVLLDVLSFTSFA